MIQGWYLSIAAAREYMSLAEDASDGEGARRPDGLAVSGAKNLPAESGTDAPPPGNASTVP